MTDKLDSLLKDWSAHTATDQKAIARLEQGIALKMRESRHLSTDGVPETAGFSPWGRLAWFALGAAAAFAITLAFVRLPPAGSSAAIPAIVRSSESVHRLFDEVNRLFAGNLRWIAQSDGAVELGISPDHDESSRDGQPFAVHIAVVSRAGTAGAWKKVWESDILTQSEQAIDIVTNPKHEDRVALWIYPVAKGQFAVDSRLSLNAPVRIYTDSSDVVRDGKPKAIAVMTIGGVEYRVYQTVTCLTDTVEKQKMDSKDGSARGLALPKGLTTLG